MAAGGDRTAWLAGNVAELPVSVGASGWHGGARRNSVEVPPHGQRGCPDRPGLPRGWLPGGRGMSCRSRALSAPREEGLPSGKDRQCGRVGAGSGLGSARGRARFPLVVAVALLALAISGCGWQLRGASGTTSLDGQAVQVANETGSAALGEEVREAVTSAGGHYSEGGSKADWVLTLYDQRMESETAAVGADGEVQDYRLTYTLEYGLEGAEGGARVERDSVAVERSLPAPGNPNERQAREQALKTELRTDAVRLMMLRLQALG